MLKQSRFSLHPGAIGVALWLCTGLPPVAMAQDTGVQGTGAPTATAPVAPPAVRPAPTGDAANTQMADMTADAQDSDDALEQAHFSMQLQNAPLLQMLSLIGNTTPVRFRYATPPDAVVTTTLQDAPLLTTLENLLHSVGFITQRNGLHIFISRQSEGPASREGLPATTASALPVSWQIWTRSVAPPARWMAPLPVLNRPRIGTKDQWQMEKDAASAAVGVAWRPVRLNFEAQHRPGIAVMLDPLVNAAMSESPVYLRWNLTLREVPRGAQLLLESPDEMTLYVNGAPLLRRFRGTRLVDLNEVLQPGDNCLAIALRREKHNAPPAAADNREPNKNHDVVEKMVTTPSMAGEATTAAKSMDETDKPNRENGPLLRYEWFFGGNGS